MTVRECYEELGSDFDKVLSRLVSEALVKKFALKFLDDPSFGQLETALADKDAETAFRAAHTLKGICLNLGFDNLFAPSQELNFARECAGHKRRSEYPAVQRKRYSGTKKDHQPLQTNL